MQSRDTSSSLGTSGSRTRYTPDWVDPQTGFPAVIYDPVHQTANPLQVQALNIKGIDFFLEALTLARTRMDTSDGAPVAADALQKHETKSSLSSRNLLRYTPAGVGCELGLPAVIVDPVLKTAIILPVRALDKEGIDFFLQALTAAKAVVSISKTPATTAQ